MADHGGNSLRGSRCARLLMAVLAATLVVTVVPARAATAPRADGGSLESARRKIAAVETQLRQARATQADAEAALREADAQLSALEAAVNEAGAAVDAQQLAVDEAAARVGALETEVDHYQQAFAARAAELYKRGVAMSFEAVLDAGSIGDALERSAYIQALNSSDQASLELVAATRSAVEGERRRLADERDRLVAMRAEQEQLRAKVAELRQHRALAAAAARTNVAHLEQEKDNLEAESQRIAALIRERERAALAATAATRGPSGGRLASGIGPSGVVGRSGYIWPRCATVTSEFGRRWGRMHQGIDIDGDTGNPIFASKAGTVIYAGSSSGYGLLTLISHGDGVVTAYAHQSALGVRDGQRVAQGQRIGSVGNTGNSTGPHLHFETRVNGNPVNPRQFLPRSC
ncbi:MAG: peptidoglycan DD-metalloendopeptidase family protein [Actinomycetota bacterium]|nr:peptidoglycan DD-metalloendopeptidase family protein [Actinomycetota bacterium]